MNSPVFQLLEVERKRGTTFRLRIPHLDLPRGSSIALIGPTGAGKTTLLQLLAGTDHPSVGTIRYDGQAFDPAHLPITRRREITMVFQHARLLTGSVRFNIEVGMRLRKDPRLAETSEALLEQFELSKHANQDARTLSGGQQQLVAIARALAVRPSVLLLDEPSAHLDPARVQLVEHIIREYQRAHPSTVIWSTHHLFQARRIADHTGFLLNGDLIEFGETERIFTRAADARTTAFIDGRMIY